MRSSALLLIVLLLGGARAFAADPQITIHEPPPSLSQIFSGNQIPRGTKLGDAGLFEDVSLQSGGLERHFRMVVPSTYDPARPIGVLFGFQGGGGQYFRELAGYHEAHAAEPYWICLAPVVRGDNWDFTINAKTNPDVQYVQELYALLKKHYRIDEDRVYAEGFCAGALFCITVSDALPGFFAAINPNVPPNADYGTLPAGTAHACIACGGTRDDFKTDAMMASMQKKYAAKGLDGDFYVYAMGHQWPRPDLTASPALRWGERVTRYFLEHPRGRRQGALAPPSCAAPFRDDFAGSATLPDAARWRVEPFGATGTSGILGEINGFAFQTSDGWLAAAPTGAGPRGGLCLTSFTTPEASSWRVSFMLDKLAKPDPSVEALPIVLRGADGRMMALSLTGNAWRWLATDTCLAFRVNDPKTTRRLAAGAGVLRPGAPYVAEFRRAGGAWAIRDPRRGIVARGTLKEAQAFKGPLAYGFGLRGASPAARFNDAELATDKTSR